MIDSTQPQPLAPQVFLLDKNPAPLVDLLDIETLTTLTQADDLLKSVGHVQHPALIIIGDSIEAPVLLATQLRPRTPAPILIILPEQAPDEMIQTLGKLHLVDYIMRPFNKTALNHRIRQLKRLCNLENNNAHNRSIAELASDYVYTMRVQDDNEIVTEWVADEIAQVHGYTSEEMTQPDAWRKTIHPDERKLAQQRLQDLLQGKARTDIFRIVAKDGSVHWVEEHAQPIIDDATGQTTTIYGAGRDITEIKATEQKLYQVQETLQLALEATQTGIWDWNLRTDAVYFSPGWAQSLGYHPDELPGRVDTWHERIHPDDKETVSAMLQAHFDNEDNAYNVEHRLLGKDGEYHWVRARGRVIERDANNNPLRMVGVQIDIHQEKLMREQLATNEERHRIISETISDYAYSYIVQEDGTLKKDWSTNAFQEIYEDGWENLVHPDDIELGVGRFKRLLAGEVDVTEFRIITRIGETRWLLDHGYPVVDEKTGRVVRIYGAAQDITERKRFEEELQRHAEELHQRNEELDAFAYTVAHDLKNPISSMMGFASLMKNYYSRMTEDKVIEYLDLIMEAGYKLKEIINALLLLARVNKTDNVEMSELDMQIIVSDTKRRLTALIEEKGAVITAPQDWPTASGYGPWVEEIWTNYISNALKYGGEPPQVELGAEAEGETVRFFVRDNGNGLTEEEQQRVFTPFTRLNQVKAEGHGLGLSIVQRIVNKLGGEVRVESYPGQGSVFSFTLPRQRARL